MKTQKTAARRDNDSILDLDLNPDGVNRPFMFEPQHSSGEEEISVDVETQEEIQGETSTRTRLGNC